jgi:sporulation protein YlmC with PRC-barrel domain
LIADQAQTDEHLKYTVPPDRYVVLPVPRGDLKATRSNPLLRKDVLDEHGEKLGTLEKLVMDTKTGKVDYAVVSLQDGRLIALPWKDVKTSREKNAVAIRSSAEQLLTASGETARDIEGLMSPGILSGSYLVQLGEHTLQRSVRRGAQG